MGRLILFAIVLLLGAGGAGVSGLLAFDDDKPAAGDKPLSRDDAKKLKAPVANTKESIARGKLLYIRDCTECHGTDGKSQLDAVANATDLTRPELWTSGITEGEIYRSIRDGAGDGMPPFKAQIEDDNDLWHLVNYLRSLWPDAKRPQVRSEATN